MYPGKVAGWRAIEKGGKPAFVLVSIYAKSILVHRIIWEMHNGTIPAGMQIDHIDMDVFNNRIENLRLATTSQNKANNKKYANNTSGFKGVSRDRTRWKAVIGYGGKRIRLGHYSTPEEAHMAYCVAAKKFQGEFARLS